MLRSSKGLVLLLQPRAMHRKLRGRVGAATLLLLQLLCRGGGDSTRLMQQKIHLVQLLLPQRPEAAGLEREPKVALRGVHRLVRRLHHPWPLLFGTSHANDGHFCALLDCSHDKAMPLLLRRLYGLLELRCPGVQKQLHGGKLAERSGLFEGACRLLPMPLAIKVDAGRSAEQKPHTLHLPILRCQHQGAHPLRPKELAKISAVGKSSPWPCTSGEAWWSSRSFAVATWPSRAASIRAVSPSSPAKSTVALRCSRARTTATWPSVAAARSKVSPSKSLSSTSLALASMCVFGLLSHAATARRSPNVAAITTASGTSGSSLSKRSGAKGERECCSSKLAQSAPGVAYH
eukprot:7390104-Prymnesium_polylepis.1